jgi:hypothetical protein
MAEGHNTIATLQHMRRVQHLLCDFAIGLLRRGQHHDDSKLGPVEKPHFDRESPMLSGVDFGSAAYEAALSRLTVALRHHYAHNSHHPEHYPDGIAGMDLYDLIEMVLDWKASSERRPIVDMGLEQAFSRFAVEPQLQAIIRNTALRSGWLGLSEMTSIARQGGHDAATEDPRA